MTMPSFTYVRPKSLEETFRHLSTGNARIHAGGTDLLGLSPRRRLCRGQGGQHQPARRSDGHRTDGRAAPSGSVRSPPSARWRTIPSSRNAIPPSSRPPGRSPARSSATRGRSGETSARNRGAGTTGGIFTAPGRGEASVLRWPGRISTTASWEGKDATSCTPPTWRRR